MGEFLKSGLTRLSQAYPQILRNVRGLGLMLGIELAPDIQRLPGEQSRTQAVRFAQLLHSAGLLTIPAGAQVLRLLPPLNLRQTEAEEGLAILETVVGKLAG
jgi:acetylornithine/N-succinyldiaminopimelate aminotransferase